MIYTVYFHLLTNGCLEVEAESNEAAHLLIENMSDEELLDICNPLIVEFVDEDGNYLEDLENESI